jgi:hypothetical protein
MIWLQEGLESGSLTADQVFVAKQAVFAAVAGLLEPSVNQFLNADAVDTDRLRQEVYRKADRLVILTLTTAGEVFVDHARSTTNVPNTMPAVRLSDLDKSQQAFHRIRDKFLTNGYMPMTRSDQ